MRNTIPISTDQDPATVISGFDNGDPQIKLIHIGNGIYQNSWTPKGVSSQINITVRANSGQLQPAKITFPWMVQAGLVPVPAVFSGGIVNAASYAKGAPIAPGTIIAVYGSNMAGPPAGAPGFPLGTILSGATLTIAGIDVPLFYSSSGLINAQLPFELPPNTKQKAVVKALPSSLATVSENIDVGTYSPGIFSKDGSGTGQGAIVDRQGRFVDSTAPARAGDIVLVYATGLGATVPAVKSGDPAPSSEPLARVLPLPTVTIGGIPASVSFAGLSPGFASLYQLNVQIPAGVQPGPVAELVIKQGDVTSNMVTLAIKP